ncbi:MAG: DUF3786 domain-containing protein [Desulfobacterales bacterium]|nr:DUF3786 domain-containing protein [Desulfobacterales bacterium]
MATGACGINCDVCRLNLLGLCTTCGSGKSHEAGVKLAAQERVLGDTCPILTCVCMNQKSYCMRDCSQFPCDNFTIGPYPFSDAYLEMQKRRRREWAPRLDPLGKPVEIPDEYWDVLQKKDLNLTAAVSETEADKKRCITFDFLDLPLVLDPDGRQLQERQKDGTTRPLDIPLLTLTVLIYFKTVDRLFPMGKDLISTKEMGGQGDFFTGDHKLRKTTLLNRFAGDAGEFAQAALALGGNQIDMGDAAWVLYPFPRVAVYYLFWDLDSEYESRLSILFDRCIEKIFTPPMVWELVNLVNARLLSV